MESHDTARQGLGPWRLVSCRFPRRSRPSSSSDLDCTLAIEGESGVEKDVAARAIRAQSKRRDGVLVCANLAAIPESLLEAERRALLAASRYRAKNGRLRPERRSPWRGRPRHS